MSFVNSDPSEKFPPEGGKEPSFNLSGLSDLFLVFGQDKERFLRKVSSLTLIFCQGQTKSVKTGIIFRNDRLQVYLPSHYMLRVLALPCPSSRRRSRLGIMAGGLVGLLDSALVSPRMIKECDWFSSSTQCFFTVTINWSGQIAFPYNNKHRAAAKTLIKT